MTSSSDPSHDPASGDTPIQASVSPSEPAQQAAPARRAVRPPYRIILEQPFGVFRKIVMIGLVLALAVSVMFNFGLLGAYHSYVQTDPKIREQLHSGSATGKDKIAVITVDGAIMESDGFVKRQIDRVRDDGKVKAIVLRVNSPGGTVTASHYLFHHLSKLRQDREIPLVVSMGGIAASGGYYISMAVGEAEDTIFAEETTWTGSVGVIIPSYDLSELLEKWHIRDRSYASGDLKQMGSPTRHLDEAERKRVDAKLQALVDDSFQGFKKVIAHGRPKLDKDKEAMAEVETGQIFTANQAYRLGVVDKLGYIEDAVRRAAELAGLDKELKNVRVVKYERPPRLLDVALGAQASAASFDLSTFLDLTAPRAYYLCTWLPAVATNQVPR